MTNITLSAEQQNLINTIHNLVEESGNALHHDLSDPEHNSYVKLIHTITGHDETNYPGLHKMLDTSLTTKTLSDSRETTETGWETSFGIPEIGVALNSNNLAAANGYGTVVGGFQTCNLSLLIRDSNGKFLATGANAGQAPLNSLAVGTNTAQASQAVPDDMVAYMTYTYRLRDGSVTSKTISALPAKALADPKVEEPKHESGNTNPYNPNAICIGLGRPPGYLTRVDYIYNEPIQNHPIGRLPLVGTVVFSQPIKPLSPGNNFTVEIFVIRTDTGGRSTNLDPTDMSNVYNNFFIDPADSTGKTLAWNLPMEANGNPPPSPPPVYNPVVFSNIPWSTEMVSYLTVNIRVTLQDGNTATAIIQSSDVPDGDPLDGIAYIKPIEFVWHCLGEDTLVTMADGSTKNITEFEAGDEVKNDNQGSTSKVSVTHVGAHPDNMLQIETDGGHSLLTSTHHIIFTPSDQLHAHHLEVGDELITLDGTAKITSITNVPKDMRNLWNLSLGDAPQRDDPNPNIGAFFANSILVGDARAERALRYKCSNDITSVKNKVPESFHKDVESTFRKRGLLK